MSQEHARHHHHDHDDDDVQEHREHGAPLTEVELRVRARESLLVDKGLVDTAALDAIIDTYDTKVGPRNGAKVVAHTWVDPDYRRRRLEDGTAAVAEYGFVGRQSEKILVVEHTPKVHNMTALTTWAACTASGLSNSSGTSRCSTTSGSAGRHATRPAHRVARARMSS